MNPSAKISTSVSVRRGKPKSQSSKDSTDLPSWTALSNADTADTSDEDETLVDELRLSPVTMYQHPGRQPNSQQPVALNGMTSMPPSTGTTTSRLPPPELAPGSFQPSQPYVIIHDHNLPVSVPGLATATTPSRTSRANLPEAQGTAGLPLQGLTPLQAPISQSNASTTSPLSKRPLKPWEILDEAVFPVRKKPKIAGTSVISFIAASQAPSPNKQQPGSPMKSPNHYGQQTASSVVSSPVALVPESPPQPPSSGPSCQGGRSMDHRVQTRNHRLQKPPSRISDTVSAEWKRVNDALETHVGSVRILPQYAQSAKDNAAEVLRLHVALRNCEIADHSKGKGRAQPGWTHPRWSNVGEFKERLDLFYGPGDINRGLGRGPRNKKRPEAEDDESAVAPETKAVDAPDTAEVPGITLTEDEDDTEAILQGMRRGRLENPSRGKGSRPTEPRATPGTSPKIV